MGAPLLPDVYSSTPFCLVFVPHKPAVVAELHHVSHFVHSINGCGSHCVDAFSLEQRDVQTHPRVCTTPCVRHLRAQVVSQARSVQGVFASLPFYLFAMDRRAAVSSWAVKAAEDAGMGRGECVNPPRL